MGPELCEARVAGAVLYLRGLLPNKAKAQLVDDTQLALSRQSTGADNAADRQRQTNWRTQCNGFYRQDGNDKHGFPRYTQIENLHPGFHGGYILWDQLNEVRHYRNSLQL